MNKVDDKILSLIPIFKEMLLVKNDTAFADSIGISKQHLNNIKNEKAHFTAEHIYNLCHNHKVNANWIFDLSPDIFNDESFNKKSN